MKRFLSALLVLTLLLSFVACTKDDTPKTFERGTVSGSRYKNEFLGLGVNFDESWVFYTDEEIASLYGLAEDFLNEDFGEYLENATIIYDMQAVDTAYNNNVGVCFEKLNTLSEAQTANMETFVSSVIPTVANSLESAGCTDVTFELMEFKIGSKTYYGGKMKANLQGFELYQALIFVKCNGYVSTVTVTSVGADRTQSIIDCFYTLK